MKFDDQLATYLYEYKLLQLEGIGTFTLDEKVRMPVAQEKEVYYPLKGVTFIYNPKSITDENLIFFLVKKLHKIEPLIRSDIESYLSNIKVFVNIGNPYTIAGIGTLIKNNQGIYEFTPGNFLPAKEELYPVRENADHNYPVRSKFSAARILVTILIVISAIAVAGGIGWGISNFFQKRSVYSEDQQQTGRTDTIAQEQDTAGTTVQQTNIVKDTAILLENTPPVLAAATVKDTVKGEAATYKMVFEVTKSKERAHGRIAQLNSLHSYAQYDSIPINDSVAYYRLFLVMKISPVDSARVRDSLAVFFRKKITMEKLINK